MTALSSLHWTDAPNGSAGHVEGQLVVQIRRLGVGGWSAGWCNGMHWDVTDQLSRVTAQSSRHFKTRHAAKVAVAAQLRGAPSARSTD
jgi:hypothetical protein